MGYFTELWRQKNGFELFCCDVEYFLDFAFCSSFLYDFFINKARKLEVAESNPIMENIPVFFSVG